jgi:hypothetical protein
MDAARVARHSPLVANIQGYPVVTTERETAGHVAGESQAALVVECGQWPRKAWHALPKQYASVDEEEGCVLMQVSKEMLVQSPKLKHGVPVDDEAVASWWGLD